MLYPLVGRIFHSGYTSYDAAVEVSGQRRELAPSIKEPGEARPLAAWQAMKEAWGDTLPGAAADLWTWLLDQPTDKLLELLAFVTAANLNGVKAKHDQSRSRLENAEQIAVAVGLDMRSQWTADATFLNRLSKAGIAEVLEEARCASQWCGRLRRPRNSRRWPKPRSSLPGKAGSRLCCAPKGREPCRKLRHSSLVNTTMKAWIYHPGLSVGGYGLDTCFGGAI
ncbi:hypothetical protein [Rhizobium leguminosarum]